MDGQLIVYTRPDGDAQSILFLMLASKPDLEMVCSIFRDLIEDKFSQCIINLIPFYLVLFDLITLDKGYKEEQLCPKCVETAFGKTSTIEADSYKIQDNLGKVLQSMMICIMSHISYIEVGLLQWTYHPS